MTKDNHFDSDTHTYYVKGKAIPSCSDMPKYAREKGWFVGKAAQDQYMSVGTEGHKALELSDKAEINPSYMNTFELEHLASWNQFKVLFEVEIIQEYIEYRGYCKDPVFGFTIDRIVKMSDNAQVGGEKGLYIIDIKTGTYIDKEYFALQTIGYKIGFEDSTTFKIKGRATVSTYYNPPKVAFYENDVADTGAFLSLLYLKNYFKE